MVWRGLVSALGTALLVLGLGGSAFVAMAPTLPPAVLAPISDVLWPQATHAPATAAATARSITRLIIHSIDLDTAVVPAARIEHDGAFTWEVPRFVAAHAEGTVGAGETGNAVVIGHVTSLTLGHVFEHLERVKRGDAIEVFAADEQFVYVTTSAQAVDRTDAGVLDPTDTPTLTLITCTGAWLPLAGDYAERFVVRAELVEHAP